MQKRVSGIRKADFGAVQAGQRVAAEFVSQQRSKMVPQAAIINNFDPDQRGFLTEGLQGLVMLQDPAGAKLAAHLDYGVIPPGQTKPLRPVPGASVLAYPAPAVSPAINVTFVRGGKLGQERPYPSKLLTRAHIVYTFGDTTNPGLRIYHRTDGCIIAGANYVTPGPNFTWDENSPLPPGLRYLEKQDLEWALLNQFGNMPPGTRVSAVPRPDIYAFQPMGLDYRVPAGRLAAAPQHKAGERTVNSDTRKNTNVG